MLDVEKLLGGLIGAGLDRRGLEMPGLDAIDSKLPGVEGNQQALNLYLSSLLAIEVDTVAEKEYLRTLATRLQLPPETLDAIHQRYQVVI